MMRWIMTAVFVIGGTSYAMAAEIAGEIAAMDEQGVAILVQGGFEPRSGDKFTVVADLPGVGEAAIAQGEVRAIDDGIVLGKITSGGGKVTVGRKVKFDSPQAVRKQAASPAAAAAILGKVGAVVDREITIVTTSKVDPAVGDSVEVLAETAGGAGATSVGVGKVTAVEGGLITARIERVTGALGYGAEVKITSAAAPATASAAPSGTAPAGELLGLKLEPVDASVAELLDLPKAAGLVVRSVAPGSLAETAGLKKRDVLLRTGGTELNDLAALRAAAEKAGAELKVEIWRDGAAQTVVLTLPAPATPVAAPSPPATAAVPVWIGLAIETYRDDVRVNGVIAGSPGARAGFRTGDRLKTLDGEEVAAAASFTLAISGGGAGKPRRIEVTRGDERLTFELVPEPRPTVDRLFAQMKKLAEAGDHDAQCQLGTMYETGQGVPDRDLVAARRWMQPAAEAGVASAQYRYGIYVLNGHGGEKNPTEGIEWLQKAGGQQDPGALLALASVYQLGIGTEKHEAEARHWYGRAVKQGSLDALVQLGNLYEFGNLYEKDLAKAAECFREAAHRGYVQGQTEWGRCLKNGIGVEQDLRSALRWLKTAADAGDPRAGAIMGEMYFTGEGVAQDRALGVKLFHQGAAAGQAVAQYNLGVAYANGQGVPTDNAEGYRWYRAAAERGHENAYVQLGHLYETGRGVVQNDEQAVTWFRKSAEAGIAEGQYNLAVMYSQGRGVEQSEVEAMQWYLKAAQQDYPEAEWYMGIIALEGRVGQKDPATAFTWFKAAAEHGNAKAQCNLGALYETGAGVARNPNEAIKWYERSAAQKESTAIDALRRLGRWN